MELFLGIESVSLVECGVVVTNMFPEFLIDVGSKRRDDVDGTAYDGQGFEEFSHLCYYSAYFLDLINIMIVNKQIKSL